MPPTAPSASPAPHGDGLPSSALSRAQLIEVLNSTVGDLERLDLALGASETEAARRLRHSLICQIRDHVLPRIADAEVPAIVVVGGSTGAGKSTLVNSALGAEVSVAGVLRPTTRTPVLVVNPEDRESLSDHSLAGVCAFQESEAVPAGLALVDASDLDSVHESNRVLAARLLESADLWLFVTTAARYGDQTPWSTLEAAAERKMPIAIVLNRVRADVLPEVRRDLMTRLDQIGLAEAPFFVIPDAGPHEGLLPDDAVAEIRDWLRLLAGRHRAAGLVRRGGRGLWSALKKDLAALADAVDVQDDAAKRLEEATAALLVDPGAEIRSDLERGEIGDGAPATRWVTLASSGAPLAPLATGSRLPWGMLGRAAKARVEALAKLASDAQSALASRLEAALVALADDVQRIWAEAGAEEPAGRLLPAVPDSEAIIAEWADAVRANPGASARGLRGTAIGDLIIAAAAGVEGSRAATDRLRLDDAVNSARASLTATLDAALARVAPPGTALSLAPDPALAAALRLRSGELTPFTRPGATA
ncbi:GTPase [Actinomyces timonensis]|uniref:GTPase n=1 Tax=Actinomyces timonensis TaxID=1288391 RepID=A0AAU8MZI4_9ACTO